MTLKGERVPNTRQKEEGIQLAFQTTSKDIPGNQELVDTQIRIGSIIVVLTFTTEGFYDEAVIRNKFENAAKSGVFGDMTDSDTNFWFKPLNNPQPPLSVKSTNANNVVTVSWKDPKRTFFRTEHFIIQSTIDNWKTVEEHQVPSNHNSFSIKDVPPTIIIKFKIYTGICNSIRSLPSDEVFTHVIGRESTNNKHESAQVQVGKGRESFMKNKEYENAQVQVEKDGFSTSSFCISDNLAVHEVKLLHSERLIFSERYEKRLLTCTLDEKQMQTITVKGYPCNITTIDELNVAVSLKKT
ncbi:unnamed protein product [Mytilus edulis]|uniref:Fibronectin type-III domain-containing protein n=1 Tax=Mytilus edulis TaxID=6550 RepID=A0A8S3REG1_MYTED|nr:unnamed protein product [Mytilus edulis]